MSHNKKDGTLKHNGGAIVVKDMKSYADHPFFVKKAEEAKAFMSKVVFPEHLKK